MSGPSASRRPARRSRSAWRSPASYSASSILALCRSHRRCPRSGVFLQRVGEDPAGNTPESGARLGVRQGPSGVRAWPPARRSAASAPSPPPAAPSRPGRGTTPRSVGSGEVLQRLEDARKLLLTVHPSDELEAVREILTEEEEQQAAVPLAAATRDVLGRLEAADLPVEVLARALNEVRLSQALGHDAAAVSLERLKTVASLPWTARAAERVDIEAAMAELDAAPRRPAAGQGAHPAVPGRAPVGLGGVDGGGRRRVLPPGPFGAVRAAPPRRASGPGRHPLPGPLFRRTAGRRQDGARQADRHGPGPPGGDRRPRGRVGRGPPSAACRPRSGRPRRAGSSARWWRPRSATPCSFWTSSTRWAAARTTTATRRRPCSRCSTPNRTRASAMSTSTSRSTSPRSCSSRRPTTWRGFPRR